MKLFWKIYFFLIFLQALGVPIYMLGAVFSDQIILDLEIFVYLVIGVIGTIGLWGFVYKRAVWKVTFWIIFSPLFILLDISVHMDWIQIYQIFPVGIQIPIMMPLLAIVGYMPQYYALLSYAYKSSSIWDNGNAE